MKNYWFTSDLHLLQKGIVKKLSPWAHANPDELRDFEDEYEMSNHVIEKINEYLQKDDVLYILGDVIFSRDMVDLQTYIRQINCNNIHLILGNHDSMITKNMDRSLRLFSTIKHYDELRLKYPLEGTDPNRDSWEGRQLIVMCHYAMRVWNQSHRDSWMLYGHSHRALDGIEHSDEKANNVNKFYQRTKTIDVGLDNAKKVLGEYRPFHFDEIKEIMKKRNTLYIDHHEKKIND